jgi:hypothetical protein
VESAPRAYRLKVSNAAPSNFNIKRDDSNGHVPEGIAAQEKGVLARFGSVSDALASAALCVF